MTEMWTLCNYFQNSFGMRHSFVFHVSDELLTKSESANF